jgi:hypothetical protein
LKLNPEKCKFIQTSIDVLGYTVTADGVKTQRSKVAAITDWPACTTVKEVKSFRVCVRITVPGLSRFQLLRCR